MASPEKAGKFQATYEFDAADQTDAVLIADGLHYEANANATGERPPVTLVDAFPKPASGHDRAGVMRMRAEAKTAREAILARADEICADPTIPDGDSVEVREEMEAQARPGSDAELCAAIHVIQLHTRGEVETVDGDEVGWPELGVRIGQFVAWLPDDENLPYVEEFESVAHATEAIGRLREPRSAVVEGIEAQAGGEALSQAIPDHFVIEQTALVNGFLCGFVKQYTADDELLADTVTAMLPDDPASLSTIRPRSLWHFDEDGNHCCLVGHDAFREAVKRAGATFEEVDSEFPRRWAKKNRGLVSGQPDLDHVNWNENQRRAQEALALDFIHSVEDEAS